MNAFSMKLRTGFHSALNVRTITTTSSLTFTCDANVYYQEYVANREAVLLAIARAMDKNNVALALPSIIYQTSTDMNLPDLLSEQP